MYLVLYNANLLPWQVHSCTLSVHQSMNVSMAESFVFPGTDRPEKDGCFAAAEHEHPIAYFAAFWASSDITSYGNEQSSSQARDHV